jgi:hypothetical protein
MQNMKEREATKVKVPTVPRKGSPAIYAHTTQLLRTKFGHNNAMVLGAITTLVG